MKKETMTDHFKVDDIAENEEAIYKKTTNFLAETNDWRVLDIEKVKKW